MPWAPARSLRDVPIATSSPNPALGVALISRGGAEQLYGNEQDAIGKTIKVSSGDVQIVGVIDGGNDSMGSLTLYMPRETIAELYGDDNPSFPQCDGTRRRGHRYGRALQDDRVQGAQR